MNARVSLTVSVIVDLKMGDSTNLTVGVVRDTAMKAAADLVRTGLFHANRENKSWDAPKLVDDRESIVTAAINISQVVLT